MAQVIHVHFAIRKEAKESYDRAMRWAEREGLSASEVWHRAFHEWYEKHRAEIEAESA